MVRFWFIVDHPSRVSYFCLLSFSGILGFSIALLISAVSSVWLVRECPTAVFLAHALGVESKLKSGRATLRKARPSRVAVDPVTTRS
ncbi:hypothetical protein LSTR_LSTR005017 [Laodelphax striatellus]|uniref:Uncharacterized protein n=1 Tax=Laodelphax striatellus TaxID=195883 RepID=A0A482XIX1_LAOST|nr:hypothetical protein LSTR_LSTR005017 [Laodelphax striatellus]